MAAPGADPARDPSHAAPGADPARDPSAGAPGVGGAIAALVPPLLGALDQVEWVQRHLYPPVAGRLAETLAPRGREIAEPLTALAETACPPDIAFARDRLVAVARETVELIDAFVRAADHPEDPIGLYRALRRAARAQEALYPLFPMLDPVSRFFLEPARRGDEALVGALRAGALRDGDDPTGVRHAENERDTRGGFSLYVPETWDGHTAMPLVIALHGGSGHGRDYLWSWLRDARTRGALLLSPTARDRTWSIMGGSDVDADPIRRMIEVVAERYAVDRSRVLLTGMSDGGTYALLCGLEEDAPFTHLAPASGALHPFLLANGGLGRARGKPIYLIHGALDWMFPVQTARMAREVLAAAGAHVVYREIEDLSHTYARDENPRILDWLVAT